MGLPEFITLLQQTTVISLVYFFVYLLLIKVYVGTEDSLMTKVVLLGEAHHCIPMVLTLEVDPKVVSCVLCVLNKGSPKSYAYMAMLNSVLRCRDVSSPI